MELKFENKFEDFMELNIYLNRNLKNRIIIYNFYKYIYIFICLSVCIWAFKVNHYGKYTILIYMIIVMIVWLIIFPIINKIGMKNSIKKLLKSKEYLIKKKVITLKDKKIIIICDNKKEELNISDIFNIIVNKHNIYIFKKGYRIFAIIPFNSFSSKQERDKFISLLSLK